MEATNHKPSFRAALGSAVIVAMIAAFAALTMGAARTASASPVRTVTGGDETQRTLVEEALAAFDDAGLVLPKLRVEIRAHDRAACHGYRAYSEPGDRGDTVALCFTDRFTLLHELAHSWERHALTDEVRAAFMALTPGQVWRDQAVRYNSQGVEDVANTVARVLSASGPDPTREVGADDLTAYRILVGSPSPSARR